jgi:uncharacterized glyoxalase superfamily protein PhnB
MNQVQFIIYVANQKVSADFYRNVLALEPILDVPGMTEFEINDSCKLGIMPEEGMARILGDKTLHPASGNGIPRCEIYLMTDEPEIMFSRALNFGAKEISNVSLRNWNHFAGYVQDPDGHILAFAKEA